MIKSEYIRSKLWRGLINCLEQFPEDMEIRIKDFDAPYESHFIDGFTKMKEDGKEILLMYENTN